MNLEKSSIFFSKNSPQQVKEQVYREMERVAVQTKAKYLGLPLVIGRSKAQVFRYIEEAAIKRINSWRNKFLSTEGKEILLKSVVMALPIYSMYLVIKSLNMCAGRLRRE